MDGEEASRVSHLNSQFKLFFWASPSLNIVIIIIVIIIKMYLNVQNFTLFYSNIKLDLQELETSKWNQPFQ